MSVHFSEIYNLFWDKLYYLAYQVLRDQTDAEEVVQDTFLILWKKREELTIENLNSYLAAMVRFSVYRNLVKKAKQRQGIDISRAFGRTIFH